MSLLLWKQNAFDKVIPNYEDWALKNRTHVKEKYGKKGTNSRNLFIPDSCQVYSIGVYHVTSSLNSANMQCVSLSGSIQFFMLQVSIL